MARHNKKRNTGLLYEFLVRTISDAIIEGNKKKRDQALSIIRKHFVPGSELHKEFRLFHSLAATTVKSASVADSILEAARKASAKCDNKELDYEKSLLIRSINHNINENKFYDRRVPEYKIYATIQTLLNEWRDDNTTDIVQIAEFEHQLKEWLLQNKEVTKLEEVVDGSGDPLVERLMIKKLNERYKDNLTEAQSNIIRSYIFARDEESKEALSENLSHIKSDVVENIDNYLNENAGKDKYLDSKLKRAKERILKESVDQIDDLKIEKFLDISKLSEELLG